MLDCAYIGCQLVDEYEMTARRLVSPAEFRDTLFWARAPTAGLILAAALAIEDR